MSKLEKYIKDNLSDYTPAEDGWNIPDEKFWEEASAHFPKKKRRWGLPFLASIIIGLSAAFLVSKISLKEPGAPLLSSKISSSLIPSPKNIKEEKPIPSESITATIETNNTELAIASDSPKPQKADKVTPIKITQSSTLAEKSLANQSENIETTSTVKKATSSQTNKLNSASQISIPKAIGDVNEEKIAKQFPPAQTRGNETLNENKLIPSPQAPKLKSQTKQPTQEKSITPFLPLSKGTKTLPLPFSSTQSKPLALTNDKIHIYPVGYLYKPSHEYGVSSTRFAISLLKLLDIKDENGNGIETDGNFNSFNFHYTKWFARKWSISTGAGIAEGNLALKFCVQNELVASDISEFVKIETNKFLRNSNTSRSISEPEIILKDGLTVAEGDSITVKGEGSLSVSVFQIPVVLTRHFFKPNVVEFELGLGGSLTFTEGTQAIQNVFITRDDVQINENTLIAEEKIGETDYSIFLSQGMRFRLSRHLNLGFKTKIYIRNPYLSGIDIGLSYRFI